MPNETGRGVGRSDVIREQERDRVEAEQAKEIIEDYVVDEDDYLDIIVPCDDPEFDLARFRGLVLDDYFGDQDEYIVIGAKMRCQHMIEDINLPITVKDKNGVVFEEKEIKFEVPVDTEHPRIFNPTHSTETTATGNKVFGTVHDAEHGVNIFGFGQCSFAEDKLTIEQLAYIRDNQELVRIYGTCYVLMELEEHWENPPCVARVGARINDKEWPGALCDCRQPFKWGNGTQEGLTRLSTLYCKSMKGFITFDDSGQTSEGGSEIDKADLFIKNGDLTLEEMQVNARYIRDVLRKMGWSENAIIACLANWEAESSINPGNWQGKENNKNLGFGFAQWTPASKYFDWADEKGLDPYDIDTQLQCIQAEVNGEMPDWYSWQDFRHESNISFEEFTQSDDRTAEDLTEIYMLCHERPQDKSQEAIDKRTERTEKWKDFD